jgi:glucose-6-phosphate 1-epimerase
VSALSAPFDGSPWPGVRLSLPQGDTAYVALQGGQVLSWRTADGTERLYQSPFAATGGDKAIRAGVQVCFPQFANRGSLPKHGLVRTLIWQLVEGGDGSAACVLELTDSDATRAKWPHGFKARIGFTLTPGRLRIGFSVDNTGSDAFDFTMALHSYLRTADIAATQIHGLGGDAWFDKVMQKQHPSGETAPDHALSIVGEVDRVYARTASPANEPGAATSARETGEALAFPPAPLRLSEPRAGLAIAQAASMTETVVWNPGAELCATFADMPKDGWQYMICAEAAHVDTPVRLAAGARWSGWQQLAALASAPGPA